MKKGRKASGGRYKKQKKKKKYALKKQERGVRLGNTKKKKIRTRAGKIKTVLLSCNEVNILNPKTEKTQKTKIKTVVETPSNRFLARQNILMKGDIIDTDLGKARITNRPSQESTIQAILIEEKTEEKKK